MRHSKSDMSTEVALFVLIVAAVAVVANFLYELFKEEPTC